MPSDRTITDWPTRADGEDLPRNPFRYWFRSRETSKPPRCQWYRLGKRSYESMIMSERTWGGKWKEVEKIGEGGQGTTYRVDSIDPPGVTGVLKVLKNKKSVQAAHRMLQEVANLRALNLVNVKVPNVLDDNMANVGSDSQPYFVMSFVKGRTLEQTILESGRLTPDRAIAIAADLCRTLSQAHQNGILHRDLKPKNIMVSNLEPLDLTIVDFGLSFNSENQETGTTKVCSGPQFLDHGDS